jgi:2-polyprenyl-3-methyl-5-hydroxy-6-metoxy-1,4-benzoquinol methylase
METDEEWKEKQYWDEIYGGMENYLAMPIHKDIVEFLAHYYDVIGKQILDIGGGPGIHCKLLQDAYLSKCTNIDFSKYALRFLQHEVQSYLCDCTALCSISLGKYNLVFSIQALEHCPEETIPGIAQAILDRLEVGGYCFISVAKEDKTSDKTHVCLKPLAWWYERFLRVGFEHDYMRDKVASQAQLPKKLDWQCLYLRRT